MISYGTFMSIFYPEYGRVANSKNHHPDEHVLITLAYKPIEIAARYYDIPLEEAYQAVINEEVLDALVRMSTSKDIHDWTRYRNEICPKFLQINPELGRIIQIEWEKEMLEL